KADKPFDLVVDAVVGRDDLNNLGFDLLWNDGDLAGYAARTLTLIPPAQRGDAVDVLTRALKTVVAARSVDIAGALLHIVADENGFAGRSFTDLADIQKKAVVAIADDGGWYIGDRLPSGDFAHFANFANLVASYGLPPTREKLLTYIGG